MAFKIYLFILLMNTVYSVYSADGTPANFSKSTAKDSDITFYYFSTNDKSNVQTIPGNWKQAELKDSNSVAPLVVLFHDYDENDQTKWITELRDFFLDYEFYNVVVVDWSKAGGDVEKSKNNVKFVGELTSKFLGYFEVPSNKIFEIGLGYGAHIAGLAGKAYTNKYQEKFLGITALDPAANGFQTSDESIPESNRLAADDAQFTSCTHSNCQKYGYKKPLCRVDYYLNDGNMQPGCKDDYCSHKRAADVFVSSLVVGRAKYAKAVAAKVGVDKNGQVTITKKNNPKTVIYGQYSAPGNYQLETYDRSPYLKKSK